MISVKVDGQEFYHQGTIIRHKETKRLMILTTHGNALCEGVLIMSAKAASQLSFNLSEWQKIPYGEKVTITQKE